MAFSRGRQGTNAANPAASESRHLPDLANCGLPWAGRRNTGDVAVRREPSELCGGVADPIAEPGNEKGAATVCLETTTSGNRSVGAVGLDPNPGACHLRNGSSAGQGLALVLPLFLSAVAFTALAVMLNVRNRERSEWFQSPAQSAIVDLADGVPGRDRRDSEMGLAALACARCRPAWNLRRARAAGRGGRFEERRNSTAGESARGIRVSDPVDRRRRWVGVAAESLDHGRASAGGDRLCRRPSPPRKSGCFADAAQASRPAGSRAIDRIYAGRGHRPMS